MHSTVLHGCPYRVLRVATAAFCVHSIMRVKLAQAGKGGGARPSPFITFTITSKVAVYAPAVQLSGQTHLPCFIPSKNVYSCGSPLAKIVIHSLKDYFFGI